MGEQGRVIDEPRLVTLETAAEILGVSEAWVWKLVRTGRLPALRFGPVVWRIDRRRVDEYAAARSRRRHARLDPARIKRARPVPAGAEVMTVKEAAAILGVVRQTILHRIDDGKLRATRAGGKWLVSATDVNGLHQALRA